VVGCDTTKVFDVSVMRRRALYATAAGVAELTLLSTDAARELRCQNTDKDQGSISTTSNFRVRLLIPCMIWNMM
jgi:hypothetical protein